MRISAILVVAACSRSPEGGRRVPVVEVTPVDTSTLCVTMGAMPSTHVDTPTLRAVALGRAGDAASIRFTVQRDSTEHRALASGQDRHQLGLKLRAADGCNLIYVMWRRDPTPMIEVSIKRNPGAHVAKECGNAGYTKVAPSYRAPVSSPDDGHEHELRAEITGDALTAWLDAREVWHGTLPDAARELTGAPGIRADNLAFDLTAFAADPRAGSTRASCHGEDSE